MCIQKLKCSYCDLMFTTTRTLNVHQKKQHGHKEFQCDNCGICFAYRYELNNHRCRKLKEIIPSPLITSTISQIPIHTFPTTLQQNIQQNITPLQLLPTMPLWLPGLEKLRLFCNKILLKVSTFVVMTFHLCCKKLLICYS